MTDNDTIREDFAAEIGALIDGELSEDRILELEKQLFSDLKARALFRGMADDDRQLKQAFASSSVFSPELMKTVGDGFEERRGTSTASAVRSVKSWWVQAAAAVVLVALSAFSTIQLMENRLDRTLLAFAAQSEADRRFVANAITEALETRSSGQQVDLSEFGGESGSVTPVKTYRSVSGHWCREYLRAIRLEHRSIDVRGVACRTNEGDWVTVKASPEGGNVSGKQGI